MQPWFYIVNPTGNLVHLLNGWQMGTRKTRSCILPAEWKAMSLDPNQKDLRRDHAWRRCNRRQGKPLVSRASAGSMITRLVCVALLGEDPQRGTWVQLASNSFQVKENDRKTITRMKSILKFSHFTEVPKATQEKMKGKLTIFSSGRRGPLMKIAGFYPLMPASSPRRHVVVGSQSILE